MALAAGWRGFRAAASVLSCPLRGIQRGIIDIAFRPAAIVSVRIRRIKRCAAFEPFNQVRVGQEQLAESDQVRVSSPQHRIRALLGSRQPQ
jgi:hypothetical protein